VVRVETGEIRQVLLEGGLQGSEGAVVPDVRAEKPDPAEGLPGGAGLALQGRKEDVRVQDVDGQGADETPKGDPEEAERFEAVRCRDLPRVGKTHGTPLSAGDGNGFGTETRRIIAGNRPSYKGQIPRPPR
jgi:hypothetical protein